MWEERLLTLAREARDRAEEVLTKAETFQDARAKQKMRKIAADYEKIADRLEQAAADRRAVDTFSRACWMAGAVPGHRTHIEDTQSKWPYRN
jgi:hypothetical protein